jgi:hypothetical protein
MKCLATVFAVATICLVAPLASADYVTYNGVGLNEVVTTHCAGLLADNLSVQAGQEKVTYDGINYNGYCVDLNQYAASSNMTAVSAMALPNGKALSYLFTTYASTVTTNAQAAALGVAIWELVAETSSTLDATNGYFYITGNNSVALAANVLLASIPTGDYSLPYIPTVIQSPCTQDFIIGAAMDVPEPATMSLLALGGVGVLIRRRRNDCTA